MTEVSTATYFSPKVSGLTRVEEEEGGGRGGGTNFEEPKTKRREKLNKSFLHLRYTVEILSACLLLYYSLG